jgi:hypothetical protein
MAMTEKENKTARFKLWLTVISGVFGLVVVAAVARGHIVEALSVPDRVRDLQVEMRNMQKAIVTTQRIADLEAQIQMTAPLHMVVELSTRIDRTSKQQDILQAQMADQRVTLSQIQSETRHIRELLERLDKDIRGQR